MGGMLIMVDFQYDYLDTSIYPHPEALIQNASYVLDKCRLAGNTVIHIRTTISKDSDQRMPHWKSNNLWRCVQGTRGHKAPDELEEVDGEIVINKRGFDPFEDGQLRKILNSQKFDHAIVCGIHLHACVREVISGLFSAGMKVYVVDDAVASNDPIHAAITQRYFEERTVQFIRKENLRDSLYQEEVASENRLSDNRTLKPLKKWNDIDPDIRIRSLEKISEEIRKSSDSLAKTITNEIGKPIYFSRLEIEWSAKMIEDVIMKYRSMPLENAFDGYTVRYLPLGSIAVITPWNNPVYISLGKIIPAILYGNKVIWKPSPKAMKTSKLLLDIFYNSGIEHDTIRLLEGDRKEVAKLLNNQDILGATFTGSISAGYGIQELCSRRHLPLQAELGGNNASIIWEDADIHSAAQRICSGAFEMAGQRCTANRRVIVHEKCVDSFLEQLKVSMSLIKNGDPMDVATRVGPVVDEGEKMRITEAIERAKECCEIYQSNEQVGSMEGNYVEPTLLICSEPSSEIFQEETFGPVLVMFVIKNWDEAINACNQVKQGLVASIFTKSPIIEKRFLNEARVGILKVNQSTSGALTGAPFGGWKASGVGPPEHGTFDRDFYTRIQTVYQ